MAGKVPFQGSYEDIESLAGELRRLVVERLGGEHRGARSILDWTVKNLGGGVRIAEDPPKSEEESGSLVIHGKGRFDIFLSPYTSPLRDNFTIAHELGHYFLHFDHKTPSFNGLVIFNRYGSGRDETQANRFAAAFLMPKEEFVQIFNKFGRNTHLVAGYFEVSEPAVKARAEYIIPSV